MMGFQCIYTYRHYDEVMFLLLLPFCITLHAESPSIFLDKSGRGRRLCSRSAQFILSMLQIQM